MVGETNLNTGDDFFNTKDRRHEKFLKDPYFSAFYLMTPREDWLCVDKESSDFEGSIKKAKAKHISNLVVKDKGNVVGSINLMDLKHKKWNESNKFSISDSMSIFDLVNTMAEDCKNFTREKSPLYFVYRHGDRSKEPVGLITFWDLNRAPVYILSYLSLLYVEQTILLKIRDSYDTCPDHSEILDKIAPCDKSGCIQKFVRDPKHQYKKLDKWYLDDLLCLYKNDPHIAKDSYLNDLAEKFSIIPKPRNKIAHTVKLLVNDNEKFRDDILWLKDFLKSGKEAFIDFPDSKVSHSWSQMRS